MDMLIKSADGFPCLLEGTECVLNPNMDVFAATPELFGDDPIDYGKYKAIFDMKKREWESPSSLRFYYTYPTAMFIGPLSTDFTNHTHVFGGCGASPAAWCMKCAEQLVETPENIIHHMTKCIDVEGAKSVEASKADMVGLTRGVDWQMCPGCKCRVQHDGGCNHMTCETCRVDFCYVCDCTAADDVGGHWKGASQESDKCVFVGVDETGAAKGHEKRAAAEIK
jgi:hypothetical protein